MRESLKEKAKRLRDEGRVFLVECDWWRADALVVGDHSQYRVRLYNEGDHHFKAFCTCPASVLWCSHAKAAFKVWRWQVRPWWVRAFWRFLIWFGRVVLRRQVEVSFRHSP